MSDVKFQKHESAMKKNTENAGWFTLWLVKTFGEFDGSMTTEYQKYDSYTYRGKSYMFPFSNGLGKKKASSVNTYKKYIDKNNKSYYTYHNKFTDY